VVLFIVPLIVELYSKSTVASELFDLPPTLRWLYAASLSYALGIAVYQYFCPKIVKRFANADEYVDSHYEIFMKAHPHRQLNVVLAHLDPIIDVEIQEMITDLIEKRHNTIGNERIEIEKKLDALIESLHPDAVQRYLIKDYDTQNVKSLVALWASFSLYLVGTIILLIFLIQRSFLVLTSI
jgi:hypothetical protein